MCWWKKRKRGAFEGRGGDHGERGVSGDVEGGGAAGGGDRHGCEGGHGGGGSYLSAVLRIVSSHTLLMMTLAISAYLWSLFIWQPVGCIWKSCCILNC